MKTSALIIFASLTVAAFVVAIFRVLREYDELDDGFDDIGYVTSIEQDAHGLTVKATLFDDIIAASYTSDPATWPRPIRNPR